MRKNILTIIIMAITLINTILTAVLIFVIVPTSNKTNQLVTKVASIVDLELESPEGKEPELSVSDIKSYEIPEKLTIKLKGGTSNYAVLYVSLSMNSKHKDYTNYSDKLVENENAIKEIVTEEFEKYTKDEIPNNKQAIKEQVLIRVQDLFQSDFIFSVTFGNLILS